MILEINRNVENNKFQTLVAFKEFGGLDITADDEKELLVNYPITINYKDIIFSGKFKVVNGEVIYVDKEKLVPPEITLINASTNLQEHTEDEHTKENLEKAKTLQEQKNEKEELPKEDIQEVRIALVDKMLVLNDNFQAKYEISKSQILDNEIGKVLNSKELVCQAKIKLFEEKIKETAEMLLRELKAKNNNFDKETPIEVTI